LLGTTPHEVDTLKKGSIPQAPLHIAAGIPRETLAQRPDIHQARLEAIAQSANIGAVKANLYPAFSLSGTFAFAATNIGSSSIKDLFHWQNHTITAGPGFNWPILNYGQITNAVRAQDALFQEALLKYLALILKAEQEIQDNITLYIQAKKSLDSLKVANKAAIKSTQLALLRYKDGQSNYTTVLDVERQQLQVQTALIKAQGELPLAVVALYRALGGGWQIRKCQDVVPTTLKTIMAKRTNWGNLLKKSHHLPPLHKEAQYLPNW
jgi:outer membrane protein TolC